MPTHAPRSLPVKQLETLAKREATLRGLITRNAPGSKLHAAVQEIRHSQLAVLKARRALIEYEADSIEKQRQIGSITADELMWSTFSVEEILDRYHPARTTDASPGGAREK